MCKYNMAHIYCKNHSYQLRLLPVKAVIMLYIIATHLYDFLVSIGWEKAVYNWWLVSIDDGHLHACKQCHNTYVQ